MASASGRGRGTPGASGKRKASGFVVQAPQSRAHDLVRQTINVQKHRNPLFEACFHMGGQTMKLLKETDGVWVSRKKSNTKWLERYPDGAPVHYDALLYIGGVLSLSKYCLTTERTDNTMWFALFRAMAHDLNYPPTQPLFTDGYEPGTAPPRYPLTMSMQRSTRLFPFFADIDFIATFSLRAMSDVLAIARIFQAVVCECYPSLARAKWTEKQRREVPATGVMYHPLLIVIANTPPKSRGARACDGKTAVKSGLHVHMPNLVVTTREAVGLAYRIHNRILAHFAARDPGVDPGVDMCVYYTNGLRMLWQDKLVPCRRCLAARSSNAEAQMRELERLQREADDGASAAGAAAAAGAASSLPSSSSSSSSSSSPSPSLSLSLSPSSSPAAPPCHALPMANVHAPVPAPAPLVQSSVIQKHVSGRTSDAAGGAGAVGRAEKGSKSTRSYVLNEVDERALLQMVADMDAADATSAAAAVDKHSRHVMKVYNVAGARARLEAESALRSMAQRQWKQRSHRGATGCGACYQGRVMSGRVYSIAMVVRPNGRADQFMPITLMEAKELAFELTSVRNIRNIEPINPLAHKPGEGSLFEPPTREPVPENLFNYSHGPDDGETRMRPPDWSTYSPEYRWQAVPRTSKRITAASGTSVPLDSRAAHVIQYLRDTFMTLVSYRERSAPWAPYKNVDIRGIWFIPNTPSKPSAATSAAAAAKRVPHYRVEIANFYCCNSKSLHTCCCIIALLVYPTAVKQQCACGSSTARPSGMTCFGFSARNRTPIGFVKGQVPNPVPVRLHDLLFDPHAPRLPAADAFSRAPHDFTLPQPQSTTAILSNAGRSMGGDSGFDRRVRRKTGHRSGGSGSQQNLSRSRRQVVGAAAPAPAEALHRSTSVTSLRSTSSQASFRSGGGGGSGGSGGSQRYRWRPPHIANATRTAPPSQGSRKSVGDEGMDVGDASVASAATAEHAPSGSSAVKSIMSTESAESRREMLMDFIMCNTAPRDHVRKQ